MKPTRMGERFGSDDDDRCLEQASVGKAMAFIVNHPNVVSGQDEAIGFLTSLSTYMELLSV
jgi:hypothetical protein